MLCGWVWTCGKGKAMFHQSSRQCERLLRRLYSSSGSPLRVCVVGSGPAGFYTAHQLLKKHPNTCVDILERLPVPFGLVRFGVAPDHPEVKNCINQFTSLAQSGKCRFLGNVRVGEDVSVTTLRSLYHAVVLAYGAEGDRELGIPGEDLPGVHSARAFVGWYNGLPSCRHLSPDLSGDTAIVCGHGNVALDVARMLLTPVDILKSTDICEHALDALAESKIRRVHLIGRRGPLQVAFTIKELREMTRLPNCQTTFDPRDFDPIRDQIQDLPRPRKRLTELMMKTAEEGSVAHGDRGVSHSDDGREWRLHFLKSPVEVMDSGCGIVGGVRVELNILEGNGDSTRAVATGNYEEVECNLVLRSIGYKALPLEGGVPVDPSTGYIPNHRGRVDNGLYCSGWVKTGPVGVIVTTMENAFETAATILEDYENGMLQVTEDTDLTGKLRDVCPPVLFSDWERIDERERRDGDRVGKPREKITSLQTMLDIAHT